MKINKILDAKQLIHINSLIEKLEFIDGKVSASGLAAEAKNNMQANPTGEAFINLSKYIGEVLSKNSWITYRFFPKKFSPAMVNKYSSGQGYGKHFDASHIQTAQSGILRRDFSFTLMLSKSSDYEGGELKIESNDNLVQTVHLDAGDIIIYPSSKIHSVLPVTKGDRIAYIGWISSYIKDASAHETLDMYSNLQEKFQKYNLSTEDELLLRHLKNKLVHLLSE
jgi:PKHD-type hydroxylase